MIDEKKIGDRIREQRKFILKLSQERMAEDLGMYQSDISDLEKAKSGSGIFDLEKLDRIADYLGIPLETLLFGQEGKNVQVYYGNTMKLEKTKKKMKKAHKEILFRLMGVSEEENSSSSVGWNRYSCGPYEIYCPSKAMFGINRESKSPYVIFQQHYAYVFLGNEVAAIMVTDITKMMQHIFEPALRELQESIPHTVLDVTDPLRTINPYWALMAFAENEQEMEKYRMRMFQRMDEIRAVAQEDQILYVENIYVREDFRRKGICRMLMDLLKKECGEQITWVNMEPTAGRELNNDYGHMPSYTAGAIGQLNINAAIAEHLGFTVDPDTWHIQTDTMEEDGSIRTKVLEMRKCAYRIPKKIREIMKDDGDLVALGRARQKIAQKDMEGHSEADFRDGQIGEYHVSELKITYVGGRDSGKVVFCYGALSEKSGRTQFGVSVRSPLDHGLEHEGILEHYHQLEEAKDSEHYNELCMVASFINCRQAEDQFSRYQEEISQMDLYDEDVQYSIGSNPEGNIIMWMSIVPTKGKWKSKSLFGSAVYLKESESVLFNISEKSYGDLFEGVISEEEYSESILEDYLSENGSIPLPEDTEFFLMYDFMNGTVIQQIMKNCHAEAETVS